MAKYLKRYNARLALQKLKESKAWIVKKSMLLEADDADLELNQGDPIVVGATEDGDLAIKDPKAVVVIADEAVASKVLDAITNAESLGDVEFIDKPALDAALDGQSVEDIISGLADGEEEGDSVETAVAPVADEKSVEEKCESIAGTVISTKGALKCERAYIAEDEGDMLPVADIKEPSEDVIEVADYDEFAAKVAEMSGSVQPGAKEIALNAEGLVMGWFDKEANEGKIYPTVTFASAEEMDNFDGAQDQSIVKDDPELESCDEECVDAALRDYEESARSVADLDKMTEALTKAGVKESVLGKIANTFVAHSLKEGVNVFDSKLGKTVACFTERVEADNYIAASGNEGRFTKRFFASK